MASHVLLDKQWDEAMGEMLAIWNEETVLSTPETEEQKKAKEKKKKKGKKDDKPPPPPPIYQWSVLYVRYLQVYTKLEDCYDQVVHPQKRRDVKKALEACIGRILEVKSFINLLNERGEYRDFGDILLERKLGFETLDVIPPRFLTDDNKVLLETREKFLIAALEAAGLLNAKPPEMPPTGLTEEEAIIIIQAEERGRQARQKINDILKIRAQQEVDLARQKAGIEGQTRESACMAIQRLIRGFLARARTRHDALDELNLLCMNNFRIPDPKNVTKKVEEIKEGRKTNQRENEKGLQAATPGALLKIKELEGQEMCEIIQEKINKYLNDNRDPVSGLYMPLPKKKEGGSADIVDPLPPVERPEQKDNKKGGAGDAQKKTGKTKGGQVPPPKFPEPEEDAPPTCPDFFRRFAKDAHDLYKKYWFDKDDYTNYEQKFLPDRLKSSLRPIIFEEMRLQTDDNTRVLLVNLKKKMRLERKAKIKILMKIAKKEGKEKEFKARLKAEKAQEKKDRVAAKKALKEKKKDAPNYPPPPKKPKRKKDSTLNKTLEAVFGDLLNNEVIQLCPKRSFSEYVGSDNYKAVPPLPGWAARADPSMAQVKRAVIENCIFPLATEMINQDGPLINSVLLYGGEGVGKTLLVHAACQAAGATYFNLSPRVTDGKYKGGKKVTQMLQMTFKLAKVMAPSVIYIDEIEKVFISDKKKIRSWGFKDKPNRIKKGLIKEMKALWRGDRVMLISCTNKTTDLEGKKGPNKLTSTFLKFFHERIYCPYPDYSSRMMVWRALLERRGAILRYGFDLSLLAQFSEDFSISSIEQVVKWACSEKRLRSIKRVALTAEEVVAHCYKIKAWDIETHRRVRDFGKPPPPEEVTEKGKKVGKKPQPAKN
ncbi:unnamed protein product [Calypogeia fissa]